MTLDELELILTEPAATLEGHGEVSLAEAVRRGLEDVRAWHEGYRDVELWAVESVRARTPGPVRRGVTGEIDPVYVIAGTVEQYTNYLTRQGIHRSRARYVAGPSQLFGISSGAHVALVGTYYRRPDFPEIASMLETRGVSLHIEPTAAEREGRYETFEEWMVRRDRMGLDY